MMSITTRDMIKERMIMRDIIIAKNQGGKMITKIQSMIIILNHGLILINLEVITQIIMLEGKVKNLVRFRLLIKNHMKLKDKLNNTKNKNRN